MRNDLVAFSGDHTGLTEKKSTDHVFQAPSRKSHAPISLDDKKSELAKLIGEKRDRPETDRITIE